MAKKSSSEKYKALVGIQFTQVEEGVKKLQQQMAPIGATLEKGMVAAFDKSLKQIDRLKKELREATDEETFRALEHSMAMVLDSTIKVGKEISRIQGKKGQIVHVGKTNQQVVALNRLRDSMKQVNVAQQRTVMSSQNMLRVIQDSPFGMLGMANNFQMLGEDISRGMAKGTSAIDTLKAGVKGLIMGPMAFAALIAIGTIIIQKWDEIESAAASLADKLSGVADAQAAINKEAREFVDNEKYVEYLSSLDDAQSITARAAAVERLAAAQKKMQDAGHNVSDWEGLASFIQKVGGRRREPQEVKDFKFAREEMIKADFDFRRRMADAVRKSRDGIDTDEQLRADKRETKEDKLFRDRLRAEEKFIEKRAKDQDKSLAKYLDDMAKSIEKEIDLEYKKLQKLLKIQREHAATMRKQAQELRREMQNVNRGVGAADMSAGLMGAGVFYGTGFGSGDPKTTITRAKEEAAREREGLQIKMDARLEGMNEFTRVMAEAKAKGLEEEMVQAQIGYDRLQIQYEAFMAMFGISVQAEEDKILGIKRGAIQKSLSYASQMASSVGAMFGSIAAMQDEESEKGLSKQRKMLKRAAWAQAIAASVAIFNNVVSAQTGNPLAYVAGAAAMAATIAALKVQIDQIDNPNGGTGGSAISGGFVALNQNITANRAADFTQDQQRLSQVTHANAGRRADDMQDTMHFLAEQIGDQKVVIDQKTITDVATQGKTNIIRRVHTTG